MEGAMHAIPEIKPVAAQGLSPMQVGYPGVSVNAQGLPQGYPVPTFPGALADVGVPQGVPPMAHLVPQPQPIGVPGVVGVPGQKRKRKPVQENAAPKRAKTAYLIFCDKHRPEVQKEVMNKGEPDKKCTKEDMMMVTTRLAELWKNVSEAEKKECEEEAAELKVAYEEAKAVYLAECKSSGITKVKKGIKKDKAAPKKAATAYTLFMQKERPSVAQANPKADFKEVSILMGKRWRELGDEAKKEYRELAEEESKKYKAAMEAYRKATQQAQ